MVNVGIHEMSHALGFSSNKFSMIKDSNGNSVQAMSSPTAVCIRTIRQFSLLSQLVGTGGHTHNVQYMILPTVVSRTRTHFSCTTMIGAQIEDGGGSGTAGSHWEKRVFNNEYLTGSISEVFVFLTSRADC